MRTIINLIKPACNLAKAVLIALFIALLTPVVYAQTVHKPSDFNHMKTGFPLTGVHINVECETCHVGGIFKGTPTDCAGCHSPGRRVIAPAKNATHIVTNAPCDSCHNNSVSFLGARFNHIGVNPRSCLTCHNGVMAPGKPGGHPVTNSPCDSCHRPNTWLPAGFDHVGVVAGTCANCHNGSNPNIVSKNPATHIVTTAACDTCHHNFNTFIGGTFDHTGVTPTTCGTCHIPGTNGAKTKNASHIPTTGNACDTCHNNYISFIGGTYNHSGVAVGTCDSCHTSGLSGAKMKTSSHVPSGYECDDCHTGTATFGSSNMRTTHVIRGARCDTCHNGTYRSIGAKGTIDKGGHPSTSGRDCNDSCHSHSAPPGGW